MTLQTGDQLSRYIRALNWAIPTITLECMGDLLPVNEWESLYYFVVMLFGLSANGTIIGSIVDLMRYMGPHHSSDYLSFLS